MVRCAMPRRWSCSTPTPSGKPISCSGAARRATTSTLARWRYPAASANPVTTFPEGTALREAAEEVGLDVEAAGVTTMGVLETVDVRVSGFMTGARAGGGGANTGLHCRRGRDSGHPDRARAPLPARRAGRDRGGGPRRLAPALRLPTRSPATGSGAPPAAPWPSWARCSVWTRTAPSAATRARPRWGRAPRDGMSRSARRPRAGCQVSDRGPVRPPSGVASMAMSGTSTRMARMVEPSVQAPWATPGRPLHGLAVVDGSCAPRRPAPSRHRRPR